MKKNTCTILASLFLSGITLGAQTPDGIHLSDYVNPFIGASASAEIAGTYHGLGKTFPGAATPYGMVQLSPNTITGGDFGSGYSYEHKTIEGFAFTQMSGVGWYGDLGNFLVTPRTGELKTIAGKPDAPEKGYRSRYSKESEVAAAGFYSVKLTDYDIRVDATVTPHCGMLRFAFPKNEKSLVQIDLARRVGGTSVYQYIKVENENTIRGWMKCTPDGGGWGNGAGKADYTVYFYAQFSKPLKNYGFWSADIPDDWSRKLEDVTSDRYLQRVSEAQIIRGKKELEGKHLGFFTEYQTDENEEILLKVGISFVDMEGAERNFKKEINDTWDFEKVRNDARKLWDEALSKVTVFGGSMDERHVFYTALYHTMIDPRSYADVDGRYTGADKKVHKADNFTKRTIFSGWDVFRSQFPLQTIINPQLVNDEVNSLITLAEESGNGYFERWEFLNAYSGCMIGNPAISVLADAWAKGIRNYDLEKAYEVALKTSEKFGNGSIGYASGYCISETLEYAYTDWCVAQLAKALGKTDDAKRFSERAKAYKNIFDKEKGWFRVKKQDGTWEDWPKEGRLQEWYGTIESNPYQQGWFVPHDVDGMAELMGGREKTLADLTEFFEKTPENFLWNNYYNHANEPVHHVPFLFNRLGAPWLTQKWARIICEKAYRNEVVGLVGNEDVGQMSAWYVLAASGLHPVCPGDTRYEITSPVFETVTFNLDPKFAKGKSFTIKKHGHSEEAIYIQKALLNGKPYNKCYLDHADIASGGILELFMGTEPNKEWGLEIENR